MLAQGAMDSVVNYYIMLYQCWNVYSAPHVRASMAGRLKLVLNQLYGYGYSLDGWRYGDRLSTSLLLTDVSVALRAPARVTMMNANLLVTIHNCRTGL